MYHNHRDSSSIARAAGATLGWGYLTRGRKKGVSKLTQKFDCMKEITRKEEKLTGDLKVN